MKTHSAKAPRGGSVDLLAGFTASASPPPVAVEVWTGYLLYWVSRQARAAYLAEINTLHLSPHQIGILQLLHSEGPMVQARIGERLRIDKGALSGEVSNLEEQGLVRRTAHVQDRRSVLVNLLGKGLRRLAQAEARNAAVSKRFFRALSSDELSHLQRLLRKVADDDDPERPE